jgi:hypothetical protein
MAGKNEKGSGVDTLAVEPMAEAQAIYLKSLAEQLAEPDAFDETLTQAEALTRIEALEARLERERHAGKERLPRT